MIFLCARWTVQDGVPAGRSSLLVVFRQVAWPRKLGLLLPTWTGDIVRFLESNQFLDSWSNDANAGSRCGVYSAWSGLYWQVWKGRWSDLLVVPQVPQVIIRIHFFLSFSDSILWLYCRCHRSPFWFWWQIWLRWRQGYDHKMGLMQIGKTGQWQRQAIDEKRIKKLCLFTL